MQLVGPRVVGCQAVVLVLLGGRFVGEAALLRFYVLHCLGIPFIFVILLAVHFWRIRRDGGISGPGKGGKLAL